jgi:hypothetical protein
MMNTEKRIELTDKQFALLGGGQVGYIREIAGKDAVRMLGPRVNVPGDAKLFCLHGADGTPVSISGSRDAALANAMENELKTVSVH